MFEEQPVQLGRRFTDPQVNWSVWRINAIGRVTPGSQKLNVRHRVLP